MSLIRRLSTRSLIGVAALAVMLVFGGVAIARSALSSGSPPPASPLDQAILSASQGPTPAGITARINFTNTLIASGSLPNGTSTPLLTGATGRLWVQSGGNFRLELQSDAGDTQITGDGTAISVFDASSNTVYRYPLSKSTDTTTTQPSHGPLTLAQIDDALSKLGTDVAIAGATPTTVAGQGAYETTLSPKHDGGLLGGLNVAFDAVTGAPLRIGITAAGSSTPVLQLEVTDISYGAVPDSDVNVTPPASAKVVDLSSATDPGSGSGSGQGSQPAPITGLAAVQAAAGFTVTAPATLDGLTQQDVRLVNLKDNKVALVTYGKGLGAIVVAEMPSTAKDPLGSLSQLPSISINGSTGRELATALGTAITFTHGDVRTLVVGSVPTVSAEQAARELAP
jgi:outer membrane lipoprotein-sorting protein